jgi:hypothetical protein
LPALGKGLTWNGVLRHEDSQPRIANALCFSHCTGLSQRRKEKRERPVWTWTPSCGSYFPSLEANVASMTVKSFLKEVLKWAQRRSSLAQEAYSKCSSFPSRSRTSYSLCRSHCHLPNPMMSHSQPVNAAEVLDSFSHRFGTRPRPPDKPITR